jgi:pimeloyl-ACP methyl ester carboxylesterase
MLEVPGGRLAYSVTGAGPLVVAVHGMGTNRHAFRLITPGLVAAGYRVAALDLRGHGESSTGWSAYDAEHVASDVLALIRELGGPAVIVGSSIASAAATFAAAEAPEAVRGIVLIGGQIRSRPLNPFLSIAFRLVLSSPALWGVFYRSRYTGGKPADFKGDTRRLLAQLRQPGRMEAVGRVLDPTTVPWGQRAAAVTSPVLVQMGAKDPDFPDPADEARATVAAFTAAPSVDLRMVEGSGHYPFLDAPADTIEALTSFIGRTVHA